MSHTRLLLGITAGLAAGLLISPLLHRPADPDPTDPLDAPAETAPREPTPIQAPPTLSTQHERGSSEDLVARLDHLTQQVQALAAQLPAGPDGVAKETVKRVWTPVFLVAMRHARAAELRARFLDKLNEHVGEYESALQGAQESGAAAHKIEMMRGYLDEYRTQLAAVKAARSLKTLVAAARRDPLSYSDPSIDPLPEDFVVDTD